VCVRQGRGEGSSSIYEEQQICGRSSKCAGRLVCVWALCVVCVFRRNVATVARRIVGCNGTETANIDQ